MFSDMFATMAAAFEPLDDGDENDTPPPPGGFFHHGDAPGEHDGSEPDSGPVFTFQDEEREIASLTMNEMARINADLLGVAPRRLHRIAGGGSGNSAAAAEDGTEIPTTRRLRSGSLASQSTISTTCDPESALAGLELALNMLPADRVSAYRRAQMECPGEVSDERKMAFVRREDGNLALAAARLARYWQFRLNAFGENRCFQPLTLAGSMIDEVVPMINHRIYNVLPLTDTAGRAIIFVDPSKRNYDKFSADQEVRVYLYILQTIAEDRRLCRRGITFLSTGKHSERKHFSRKFAQLRREAEDCSPLHVRASHLCHPSTTMSYVIHPIMKYFMPQDFRLRFRLHHGSDEEVLRALEGYCLTRDRVPKELGGDVALDMNQWVLDRMAIESARISTLVPPVTSVAVPADEAGATSTAKRGKKRSRKSDGQKGVGKSKPFANSSTKPAAAKNAKSKATGARQANEKAAPSHRKKQKKGTPGRPSDPRMLEAVQAKMANHTLPLEFVLEEAGFSFHVDPESGIVVDQDGIACKQRKNQLCRRIRQERERLAKEADK